MKLFLLPLLFSALTCQGQIKIDTMEKQESIVFVKDLDCYIDLSKVVEITALDYYEPLPTGLHQVSNPPPDSYIHAGQHFFTIRYQLKADVTHYFERYTDALDAKKVHRRIISKWKKYKNQQ